MNTEFYVDYNLYDLTALNDAVESTESNQSFADIRLIKDDISVPRYGTLEHNFFVLDGSREEFPDNPDGMVYFSRMQAGADGVFHEEQSVNIRFTESHTSVGLTLTFLETYPVELDVYWYDADGTLMAKRSFFPDCLKYFCEHQVEEYWGIKIIFKKTLPWHNVKLQYIKYGTSVTWNSSTLKSGKLVNEVDPIGDRISTDTLTFEFVDRMNDFNLGNPGGLHKTFQRRQNMLAYEIVNGKTIPLGTFFMDTNSTSKNICKIKAIDYKGILANTDFINGRVYQGEPAGNIIDEIMETAGITDYEVDEETRNTPLHGTLKIQTCQKALREVLFACGSIVNTSRQEGLSIYKSKPVITGKIYRRNKFETTLQSDRYVSDISVKYTSWEMGNETSEIAKGTYGPGIHTIRFSSPAAELSVNVGKILEQMPYYAVVEIPADVRTDIVISGRKYVGEELATGASIDQIKSGELRNSKTFSGTLLNFESAQRAAVRILDYYQYQHIIQTRHLSAQEKAGDWVEIENPAKEHGNFAAAIESMTTDLVGGFLSTAKCRGYYKTLTDYYLTGEIYIGEEAGIM